MIYLTDCGLSLLAEITRMLALDGDPRIDPNRKLFSPYSDRGQVTLLSWWKSVGRFIFLGTLAAATLLGLLTPGLGIAIFGWPSHAAWQRDIFHGIVGSRFSQRRIEEQTAVTKLWLRLLCLP